MNSDETSELYCLEEFDTFEELDSDIPPSDIECPLIQFFYGITLQKETDEATVENSTTDKRDGR